MYASELEKGVSPSFRVLSFDGGGMRGVFSAAVASAIEDRLVGAASVGSQPCRLRFYCDLLVGTSTGAIVATALALGKTPVEIEELYAELGPRVFGKRANILRRCTGAPDYRSESLHAALRQVKVGDRTFAEARFSECDPRTLVVAVSLSDYAISVFDSEAPDHGEIPLVDVLLASAAAPTYFLPWYVEKTRGTYVDGGLACNNPAIEAYRCAREVQPDVGRIKILSIGTGRNPVGLLPSRYARKTKLGWVRPTIHALMDTSSTLVDRNCTDLNRVGQIGMYGRIDMQLEKSIDLADYRQCLETLPYAGRHAAEQQMSQIEEWLRD